MVLPNDQTSACTSQKKSNISAIQRQSAFFVDQHSCFLRYFENLNGAVMLSREFISSITSQTYFLKGSHA